MRRGNVTKTFVHELIEAVHGMQQIPGGYLRAKEAFEGLLLGSNGGDEDDDFDDARQKFGELIDRWQKKNGEREQLVEALDDQRRNYEQRLIDLEFERTLEQFAEGEHAPFRRGNMRPFTAHSKKPNCAARKSASPMKRRCRKRS